jgi:ankyrin repeat protein
MWGNVLVFCNGVALKNIVGMQNDDEKVWELLEMCYYGHIDQVKRLIEEGVEINSIGRNGLTPLMAAKDGESEDVIQFLLSMGAK